MSFKPHQKGHMEQPTPLPPSAIKQQQIATTALNMWISSPKPARMDADEWLTLCKVYATALVEGKELPPLPPNDWCEPDWD